MRIFNYKKWTTLELLAVCVVVSYGMTQVVMYLVY